MANEGPGVGGTDEGQAGDRVLRGRIRAGAAIVLSLGILGYVFIPGLRGSDVALGMFVSGLILLAGVDGDKIPGFRK